MASQTKRCDRLACEATLLASDEVIMQAETKTVGLYYAFNNYSCNLVHINELKEEILKDYPDTKDEDIEVYRVLPTESIRHARFTVLRVSIPKEEFIRLRNENLIHIL